MALLRTRRWLSFTALVVIAIIGFGLLSRWQWHRAEENRIARIDLAQALSADPVPLGTLADDALEWTRVTVSGTYDAAHQVVVRRRPLNGANGFWLMTPLATDGGPTVWVNRGWLGVTGDALSTPPLPAPPSGTITVTGYARPYEVADASMNDGLPPHQIYAPAAATLPSVANAADRYVQLISSEPAQEGLTPLPAPEVEIDESRNISYAIQWILFAIIAIGGWFFFLRREAAEDAVREHPSTGGADGS
jgi:cytochrome oxidase assembly protein ShyY1